MHRLVLVEGHASIPSLIQVNMKRATALGGALVMLAWSGLTSCAAQRYRDPEAGYTIALPDGWTFRQPQEGSSVRLSAHSPPLEGAHRAHVAVAVTWLSGPHALDDFTARSFETVSSNLADVQLLDSSEAKVGAHQANRLVYRYDDGRQGLTLLSYFVATRRRGYVLSCGAATPAFARAEPTCERVLRSFDVVE